MGTHVIICTLKRNPMSSEKASQELIDRLEDRLQVVNLSINEFSTRSAYYIQQSGNASHIQNAVKELLTEKAKLLLQISAITRFLQD